jgi:hypothetical protein
MCKFADRLTHFSMYGSTTAIQIDQVQGKPKHDGGKNIMQNWSTRIKVNAHKPMCPQMNDNE